MDYFYSIEPQRTTLEECIDVVERILRNVIADRVEAMILATSKDLRQLLNVYDTSPCRGKKNHIHWMQDVKDPNGTLLNHHVESFCRAFEGATGTSRLSFELHFASPSHSGPEFPLLRTLSLNRLLEGEVYVSVGLPDDRDGSALRRLLASLGIEVPGEWSGIRSHHAWAWRIVVDPLEAPARLRTIGTLDPSTLDIIPYKPENAVPMFRTLRERFSSELSWYRVNVILEPEDLRPFVETIALPLDVATLTMDRVKGSADASLVRHLDAAGVDWLVSWDVSDAAGFPGVSFDLDLHKKDTGYRVQISSYDFARPGEVISRIEKEWGFRAEYLGSREQ